MVAKYRVLESVRRGGEICIEVLYVVGLFMELYSRTGARALYVYLELRLPNTPARPPVTKRAGPDLDMLSQAPNRTLED